jgi:hypothetical protein
MHVGIIHLFYSDLNCKYFWELNDCMPQLKKLPQGNFPQFYQTHSLEKEYIYIHITDNNQLHLVRSVEDYCLLIPHILVEVDYMCCLHLQGIFQNNGKLLRLQSVPYQRTVIISHDHENLNLRKPSSVCITAFLYHPYM